MTTAMSYNCQEDRASNSPDVYEDKNDTQHRERGIHQQDLNENVEDEGCASVCAFVGENVKKLYFLYIPVQNTARTVWMRKDQNVNVEDEGCGSVRA
jgi:hypothetical protein